MGNSYAFYKEKRKTDQSPLESLENVSKTSPKYGINANNPRGMFSKMTDYSRFGNEDVTAGHKPGINSKSRGLSRCESHVQRHYFVCFTQIH